MSIVELSHYFVSFNASCIRKQHSFVIVQNRKSGGIADGYNTRAP
jgi:hypothetical protein